MFLNLGHFNAKTSVAVGKIWFFGRISKDIFSEFYNFYCVSFLTINLLLLYICSSFFLDDGYYWVKLRGHDSKVWCVFGSNPAKTYVDISALSKFGAGTSDTVVVNKNWQRARVLLDECMVLLHLTDYTFTTDDVTPVPAQAAKAMSKYTLTNPQ